MKKVASPSTKHSKLVRHMIEAAERCREIYHENQDDEVLVLIELAPKGYKIIGYHADVKLIRPSPLLSWIWNEAG